MSSILKQVRSVIAAIRQIAYCRTHDTFHRSDFCPDCLKAKLRPIGVVDTSHVKPEWEWPLRRDEYDRLEARRSGNG